MDENAVSGCLMGAVELCSQKIQSVFQGTGFSQKRNLHIGESAFEMD